MGECCSSGIVSKGIMSKVKMWLIEMEDPSNLLLMIGVVTIAGCLVIIYCLIDLPEETWNAFRTLLSGFAFFLFSGLCISFGLAIVSVWWGFVDNYDKKNHSRRLTSPLAMIGGVVMMIGCLFFLGCLNLLSTGERDIFHEFHAFAILPFAGLFFGLGVLLGGACWNIVDNVRKSKNFS